MKICMYVLCQMRDKELNMYLKNQISFHKVASAGAVMPSNIIKCTKFQFRVQMQQKSSLMLLRVYLMKRANVQVEAK